MIERGELTRRARPGAARPRRPRRAAARRAPGRVARASPCARPRRWCASRPRRRRRGAGPSAAGRRPRGLRRPRRGALRGARGAGAHPRRQARRPHRAALPRSRRAASGWSRCCARSSRPPAPPAARPARPARARAPAWRPSKLLAGGGVARRRRGVIGATVPGAPVGSGLGVGVITTPGGVGVVARRSACSNRSAGVCGAARCRHVDHGAVGQPVELTDQRAQRLRPAGPP